MHLIIDGYNLLHASLTLINISPIQLQWERDRLIQNLSTYRYKKPCEITVVFDGWRGGGRIEGKERKKGIEIIFSKIGEKADEVIKRLIKEKGTGAVVVTSDREVSKYAERISVAVIQSDQFQHKMERVNIQNRKEMEMNDEEEEKSIKKQGPSRRLSKKEKRMRLALKKL